VVNISHIMSDLQCLHICYCNISGMWAVQLGIWNRVVTKVPTVCVWLINEHYQVWALFTWDLAVPSTGVHCPVFLFHAVVSSSRVTGHSTKVCLWCLYMNWLLLSLRKLNTLNRPKSMTTNLRWPSQKICKGKIYNFMHLLHKAHQVLSLPFSSFILHTHTHLKFPSSSLLTFHNIAPSVPSTTFNIQQLLTPFTVTCSQMPCRAVMIHTDWIIHLYCLVYTFLSPWRFTIFSTDGVSGIKNVTRVCSGFFVSCGQWEFMALIIVFTLWIVPGFIYEPFSWCLIFQ